MLSVALTIVMTFLAVALIRPAMELLQTPEEILDDAVSYIRIIFWGIGASVLFNLGSNTMRALGDSRTPLYFLIFACCVNIVLDIVLIAVVGMGVAGAGVATIFPSCYPESVALYIYGRKCQCFGSTVTIFTLQKTAGRSSESCISNGIPDVHHCDRCADPAICPERTGCGIRSSIHGSTEDRFHRHDAVKFSRTGDDDLHRTELRRRSV